MGLEVSKIWFQDLAQSLLSEKSCTGFFSTRNREISIFRGAPRIRDRGATVSSHKRYPLWLSHKKRLNMLCFSLLTFGDAWLRLYKQSTGALGFQDPPCPECSEVSGDRKENTPSSGKHCLLAPHFARIFILRLFIPVVRHRWLLFLLFVIVGEILAFLAS